MTSKAKEHPERSDTDDSLREERDRADAEIEKHAAAVEAQADTVVEQARGRADAVLDHARQKVDSTVRQSGGDDGIADELSEARASEDEAVLTERAEADEALGVERAERQRTVARSVAIGRDATDDRLDTERACSDFAVASRDEFLAVVSHDVRSLLAGIATSAELISNLPLAGDAGGMANVEAVRIRRLTRHTARLVGDLLDVVAIESGTLAVELGEHDARALVTETAERFRLDAERLGVRLTAAVPDGPLGGRFDPGRLLQVLANLVGNALKFADPGGHVAIGLSPDEGALCFTVRDDGCGIPADRLDAIFERFSQARADRRGLGLGLYIARSIVEAHGGRLGVDSTPGEGSTFHFTVPIGEAG